MQSMFVLKVFLRSPEVLQSATQFDLKYCFLIQIEWYIYIRIGCSSLGDIYGYLRAQTPCR